MRSKWLKRNMVELFLVLCMAACPTAGSESGVDDGANHLSGSPIQFNYTGSVQTYTVPAGVSTVAIEAWGAQGGDGGPVTTGKGGLGGYAYGELSVVPGQELYVFVGGRGASRRLNSAVGGFNGGGGTLATADDGKRPGAGGGASDVRTGGTALSDRVIVAGGGGGAGGWFSANGGYGGGLIGQTGQAPYFVGSVGGPGSGGTQSAGGAGGSTADPGSLGVGGRGRGFIHGGGGGGGGYYGGGGGRIDAGGGGSSHLGGLVNGTTTAGVRQGYGLVVITPIDIVSITGTDPVANALDAAVGSSIAVTFSTNIQAATVSSNSFNVDGSLSGQIAGNYVASSDVVTFSPSSGFERGEIVTVTLTTDLQSVTGGSLPSPYSWQFTVEAAAAPGMFLDSGSALGSSYSVRVPLGDLDGDGDLDAFVANYGGQANRVWTNSGGAVFSDTGQTLGSGHSHGAALADLDGDGDLDAFVANSNNEANRVWLNSGAAVFSDTGETLGTADSLAAALGDLDGDGDLDAFVANYEAANVVWSNSGNASFSQAWSGGAGANKSYDVALGDLNGDGHLDAVVANLGGANTVWTNAGNGTFSVKQTLGASDDSIGIALGDLNGDGDLDAFVANINQGNKVWFNDGDGTLTDSGVSLGSAASRHVALGDLDGDGDLDAFVVNYSSQANKTWINDGSGTFSDGGNSLGNSTSPGVALGDLDGDGDLDAFVGNLNVANKVWLNRVNASGFEIASAGPNANGTDVDLSLDTVAGRTYEILGRNNDPGAAPQVLRSEAAGGSSISWTDPSVVGSVDARFYQVVEVVGGVRTTNPISHAAFVQPTEPLQWYRLSVPIDLGAGHDLSDVLGEMLGSGAQGDALNGDLLYMMDVNGQWLQYAYDESGNWDEGGVPSSDGVGSCQGLWLRRRNEPGSLNMLVAGSVYSDGTPSHAFAADTWQLIAWPYSTAKSESANWGFFDDGAKGGGSWRSGDNIIVDGAILWLHSDGRWRTSSGALAADKQLEAMNAYYYYHRGTGFTWTPDPIRHADLAVSKAVDDSTPDELQQITYTLVLTNMGPDSASNVIVTDDLPTGVTYISSSGNDYNENSGNWHVTELAAGGSTTLTVVASVDASTGGSMIENTATIIASESSDSNSGNGSASASINVNTPIPLGGGVSNPGLSAKHILDSGASTGDGVYWIDPDGEGGNDPLQAYCDMTTDGGGWTMVAANGSASTLLSSSGVGYEIDTPGYNSSPSQTGDYLIGPPMAAISFTEAMIKLQTTGGQWVIVKNAATSYPYVSPTANSWTLLLDQPGTGISPNSRYFVLGCEELDVGDNASVNQNTTGAAIVYNSSGDPSAGCYFGHGTSEGSYEGYYNGFAYVDATVYATFVR